MSDERARSADRDRDLQVQQAVGHAKCDAGWWPQQTGAVQGGEKRSRDCDLQPRAFDRRGEDERLQLAALYIHRFR
ncbi:unnamed protein product [Symbiodinium sp. CCMP2592]|nr:unnamed protein product [Symbiodinium sp. CCMP2592]